MWLPQFQPDTDTKTNVLVLPRQTEVGIPDFRIGRNGEIVGYIEAKLPHISLDDVENTDQRKDFTWVEVADNWGGLPGKKKELRGWEGIRNMAEEMVPFFYNSQQVVRAQNIPTNVR